MYDNSDYYPEGTSIGQRTGYQYLGHAHTLRQQQCPRFITYTPA